MKLEDGDNGVPQQTSPPKSTSPEGSRNPSLSDMAVKQELSAETSTQRQTDAPRSQAGNGKKSVANSKDPLRPRRKKARRACFACQRAHLTCGDERPCQRCIKRNLQDACHDGVRKKAKYLHDTPPEALLPGVGARGAGSQFLVLTNLGQGQQLPPDPGYPVSSANTVVYAQQQTPTTEYSPYAPNRPQLQMPPPLTDTMMSGQSFSTQQSPISPNFNAGPTHQASPMQSMAGVLQQGTSSPMRTAFSPTIFDPNDPMQYSFDPSSFNFGNHYGAVEFGMLAHMSSGAADTPPSDGAVQINQTSGAGYTTPGTISTGYSGSPVNPQTFIYPQQQHHSEWPNDATSALKQGSNTYANLNGRKRDLANVLVKQEPAHGYAIGANSGSFTSPSSDSSPQDLMPGFDESPTTLYANNGSNLNLARSADPSATSTPYLKSQPLPTNRRTRDPSAVYERVTEPYSYTTGFHGLTAFIQRRFSPQKTLRIAKALASIRPSFISCTKNLNLEDLVFMEKCFQRSLWEYENFISGIATPTLVCRRTGEVAAVGKEFSLLTGWKKSVLLGNDPNLNVNTGGSYNPSEYSQPVPNVIKRVDGTMAYQPVFVAELFDDETAIDFYEAFAQLAFGDSRGSVTAQAKLLQYKTVDDYAAETAGSTAAADSDMGSRANLKKRRFVDSKPRSAETGAYPLPDKDGKLECTYCWTVKRDMFDIPMLIVMNLGIPTANIPVDGLELLNEIGNGIYFGFAGVDIDAQGRRIPPGGGNNEQERGRVWPMVMSIGWNPFYKNDVRSVEIHLITPQPIENDFYGAQLNCLVLGFIRPELDFESVEALVRDIMTDIEVAKISLGREMWREVGKKEEGWLLGF